MTKLDEMWAALEAYQPQAIAAGHGDSWSKMCSEKTADAADDAAYAADAAADAADADATNAAATNATTVAYAAAAATTNAAIANAEWAQIAIDRITKITEKNND